MPHISRKNNQLLFKAMSEAKCTVTMRFRSNKTQTYGLVTPSRAGGAGFKNDSILQAVPSSPLDDPFSGLVET